MKYNLSKLKQIKKFCKEHVKCTNCIYLDNDECAIGLAMDELTRKPAFWDLNKVEEILDGSD